jgi:putative protease
VKADLVDDGCEGDGLLNGRIARTGMQATVRVDRTRTKATGCTEDPSASSRPRIKPELLAPAGDRSCLVAAVENGADAVYFGLPRHNARIRAHNFDGTDLPDVMGLLHRRGVRGYVTLNTLAFTGELTGLEAAIRELVVAGVDALIVQDLGLVRLIRAISPDIEIHASTQMSITSEEGVELARELGCSRVILARELSLAEIGRIRQASNLPLEVFVHGALCVAYSGQCLTSEALGGRSANRGECAQACRMPYEIVCDGRLVDLENVQYLLSPQDLAAYDLIPRLIDLGVASLKIEGRLKSAEYVANITRHYRTAIDAAFAGRPAAFAPRDVQEMQLSFSRGFSHGFLDGNNHKVLVRGDYAKKRGIRLGVVESITPHGVRMNVEAPVKPGDGLVFDGDESIGRDEQGGRVYEVIALGRETQNGGETEFSGRVELRFGRESIDLRRLSVGQPVWKTDDPELTRRLRRSFEGPPNRKLDLDVEVIAIAGEPLRLTGRTASGHTAMVESSEPLAQAESRPADESLFAAQLGRLGGTIYQLGRRDLTIEGRPMVPMSVLNQLRRELVAKLDAMATAPPARTIPNEPVLPMLCATIADVRARVVAAEKTGRLPVELAVLCRRTDQIDAAVSLGIKTIYADYQDIKHYREAVAAARRGNASIYLATPRIEKPGEGNLFGYLAKQDADGILVRNAGGMCYCAERRIPFVADFSMNAANPLTVDLLKGRGALRVTASYDLNVDQLLDLLDASPSSWLEVVIHQQVPMFHMEHCVYCAFLSPGTDATNCGRPCDTHDVKLRDRVGMDHPLKADVGCRNTLFNAVPQTAAEFLPRILKHGARSLRIEFLDDSPDAVERTIRLYREALAGHRDGNSLWRDLKASNQYGVTRGPLAVLT